MSSWRNAISKKQAHIFVLTLLVVLEASALFLIFETAHIPPSGTDEVDYNAIALNLEQHHCYATQPVPPCRPTADRAPGYPLFLLLIYSIANHSVFAVRLLQFAMLVITAALIYDIALPFIGQRAAFFGACFTALYLPLAALAIRHLTELLATLLAAAFLWLFQKARLTRALWVFACLGLLAGYAALVRPSFALLALFPAALPLWMRGIPIRQRILRMMLVLVLSGACIVPWAWRNFTVAGEFVPLADSSGFNLYVSALQYSGAISYKSTAEDRAKVQADRPHDSAEHLVGSVYLVHEIVLDRQCKKEAKHIISQINPLSISKSMLLRLTYLWGVGDYSPLPYGKYSEGWHRLVQGEYIFLLLAVTAGIWFQRHALLTQWPLWVMAFYFTCVHMVYLSETRFTFPARPFLLIYAGVALHEVVSRYERWALEKQSMPSRIPAKKYSPTRK